MSYQECAAFEQKLAYHTAPALFGIKASNLFSIDSRHFDVSAHVAKFNEKANPKGLHMMMLCRCENRKLLFLYQEALLAKQLKEPSRMALLETFGYARSMTLTQCLTQLADRIADSQEFPHEIGLFLGYPVEDVIGFIENRGAHCKLCGYWKVYGDAEKAKRTFSNYTKCRNFLCHKLQQGNDLYQALHIS